MPFPVCLPAPAISAVLPLRRMALPSPAPSCATSCCAPRGLTLDPRNDPAAVDDLLDEIRERRRPELLCADPNQTHLGVDVRQAALLGDPLCLGALNRVHAAG